MTAQALYLKWRSQTFEEVLGQEHVTRTLRNALERGRIAHAYLFCGPRGTGKTSTARILAKAVNCVSENERKPCNHCDICRAVNEGTLMDLIEIDAASNTSVDDVRDLRDKIGFRPTQARYKVYVIDEVHMLSTSAFNALLKTLEEPPPHVIFVLATTEPQKIPATIISRCQRFDFRFVPTSVIAGHLRKIAEAEGLKIEPEAIDLIAAQAGGAVRDAVTLLDQLTAYGDVGITVEHVQSILGLSPMVSLGDFVEALLSRNLAAGLRVIAQLVDQGVPLRQFNTELLEYLRGLLLLKAQGDPRLLHFSPDVRRRMSQQAEQVELSDLLRYARLFSEAALSLKTSLQPQLPLELAFIEAVSGEAGGGRGAPAAKPATEPSARSEPTRPPQKETDTARKPTSAAISAPQREKSERPPAASMPVLPTPPAQASGISLDEIRQRWPAMLKIVRPLNKDAEAFLRSAQPIAIEGDTVLLAFKYEFHKSRFEAQGCQAVTEDALAKVMGRPLHVRCQIGGKLLPADRANEPAPDAVEARTREPAPAEPAEEAEPEDPLIQVAVDQFGARVAKVISREEMPEGSPPLEEPPSWE